MSYVVLARKYRSAGFDEVVGQEHVARTLKRAVESGRIAHAFLFCGTRGVGKTSMARIMAKALNCDAADGPTPTPCGKCTSCTSITRGEDMDVIEIDAASNTGVDNIREIIENSRFRPARARFKVYIIDEVHMLSKGAFNALLKTLEEPPGHVKFILATTETEKVPATILSRCQRYDFRNIPTREIAAHLKDICLREGVKADDDALLLVARAGAGSMRDALSLLDRLLSLGDKKLNVEMIEQLLGMPRAQVVFDLAGHIGAGDVKATLESTDKVVREGLSPETLVASLADHLRNLLLLATCGKDSELVESAGLSIDVLYAQARQFDPVALAQSIAVLEELRRGLRSTSAGRALLDATLVRLALAEQFTPIADLLSGAASPSTGAPSTGPGAQKKKPELTTAGAADPIAPVASPVVRTPFDRGTTLPRGDDAASAAPVEPAIATAADDADDALPAVGKVFDGPTRSLGSIFATRRQRSPTGAPVAASNVEPVDRGEFAAVMARLRDALRSRGPGFDGILVYGQIASLGNGTAVIRYSHEHEASALMLERNGKREAVQQALSELLNEPIGITIEVDPPDAAGDAKPVAEAARPPARVRRPVPADDAPPPPPPAPPVSPEQKQHVLATDPLVRAAVEMFAGDIVKVE